MTEYTKPTYEDYLNFNTLPGIEFDLNTEPKTLPTFAYIIVNIGSVSNEGAIKFLNKFMSYYIMEDEFVKKTFDGCMFLFLDKDYIGIFPDREHIIKYIKENNISFIDFFIQTMYLPNYGIIDNYEYISVPVENYNVKYLLDKESTTKKIKDEEVEREINEQYFLNISYEGNYLQDRFLFDSGASVTYLPFIKYLDPETYLYNNLEYNEDGTINDNSNKINFSDINNNILGNFVIESENALTKTLKVLIFFKQPVTIVINSKIKIKISNFSCQFFQRFSNGGLKFLSTQKRYKRDHSRINLFGMNGISKMNVTMKSLNQNVSILTLESNDDKSIVKKEQLFEEVDLYKFIILRENIKLFSSIVQQNNLFSITLDFKDYNFYHVEFNLSIDSIIEIKDSIKNMNKEFITNRKLILIVVQSSSTSELIKIKNLIKDNNDIDGLIFKNNYSPYNMTIYLKNISFLDFIRDIEYEEISKCTFDSIKDIELLISNIITSWKSPLNKI